MSEPLVVDPYAFASVDARCYCDACEARTKETYSLRGRCTNCSGLFTVVNRKGDLRPLSVECPHCWATAYNWAVLGDG